MKKDDGSYQTILEPILYLIDIEYKYRIAHDNIAILYDKYKDQLFKNENSLAEIRNLITEVIAVCLTKINKKYQKRLTAIYTDSGVNTILYDYIYTKLVDGVDI